MTPEGQVKQQVDKYLKDHGIYYFKPVQTGYGATTLDYLCCWNGRFVGIECKSLSGEVTARQRLVILQIVEAGGLAYVVRDYSSMTVQQQMEEIANAVTRQAA